MNVTDNKRDPGYLLIVNGKTGRNMVIPKDYYWKNREHLMERVVDYILINPACMDFEDMLFEKTSYYNWPFRIDKIPAYTYKGAGTGPETMKIALMILTKDSI